MAADRRGLAAAAASAERAAGADRCSSIAPARRRSRSRSLSFAVASAAIAWIVATLTGSTLRRVAGALVFALNPNVLYLQATPMTEPLLMALTLLSVALLDGGGATSGKPDARTRLQQRSVVERPWASRSRSRA